MRTPDLTPEAARELAAMDDALAGFPVEPDLTELGELALALREERPEVSPEFAASLDARDWGARERRSRLKMPSWFGFAPAFAASLFLGEERKPVIDQLGALHQLRAEHPEVQIVIAHDGEGLKHVVASGAVNEGFVD